MGIPILTEAMYVATRLVDMEGIAQKFDINIRVFEPRTNSEKAPWRLVYGHNQYRKGRKGDINLGMLEGHCFYIKKMNVLTQSWECEVCKQLFTREHRSQKTQGDTSVRGSRRRSSVKVRR